MYTNTSDMENKGKIGVTTENIFPVIKQFLYSDHEIFLRELVANAVDATQKMKALALSGDYKEELGELKAEIAARKSSKPADSVRVKEELGDLVFAVCNLARHLGVDAESAVELTTSKFSRRFRAVERGAKEGGRALRDMTLDEMDALWEAAKRDE